MKKLKAVTEYFTKNELILLISSVVLIILSFIVFDRVNYLTLIASLIGAVSLLLNAKGNPAGQLLTVVFSIIYSIISYSFCYYGEMVTYLGMTAPMAVFSFISWIRNPYNGNRSQVKINRLSRKEIIFMLFLTSGVTVLFYFILSFFHTANIFFSTISVTTSFIAAYLTFRRSPFFALAYASNDIILIILWTLAAISDISYLSVIICFIMFLANDIYGFINWKKLQQRQAAGNKAD